MRIRSGIQDQPVMNAARLMDMVQQHTFGIALMKIDRYAERLSFLTTHLFNISKCLRPVHICLTRAKQIEVWTVQDQNGCHHATPWF